MCLKMCDPFHCVKKARGQGWGKRRLKKWSEARFTNHVLGPPSWIKETAVLKTGINPKCTDTSYIVDSHDLQQ